MPPITTIVASNGPSARRKVTRRTIHRALRAPDAASKPRPVDYDNDTCRRDFTHPTWNGRRPGRPLVSISPAATSSPATSTTSGARAMRCRSPGRNDNGYAPLMEAIAAHYKVDPACVTTATGAAGANFQTCAALLEPGDEVLMERPGYDPLLGAARLLNARTQRFERTFEDRLRARPRSRPRRDHARARGSSSSRARTTRAAPPSTSTRCCEVGRLAEGVGAYVLVDEVYLDAAAHGRAARGGSWRALHLDQQPDEVLRTLEPPVRVGDCRA